MARDRLAEIHGLDEQKREKHKLYMRQWRQKQKEREQSELETMLEVSHYAVNEDNPNECLRFRMLVLGLAPQDANPFLKSNHLIKSTRGRTECKTCKPFCKCWEWYKNHRPVRGTKIW